MRNRILVAALLLSPLVPPTPASAQVSIQIGLPGIDIGINQPVYPQLVAVPGYPVYYDPRASTNYFFYDGLYWVFQGDNWYASSWYNGPWALVAPQYVPVFILRVPVRYYRHPPAYFRGWQRSGPPRWGERWGDDWEREHGGWDRWDRANAPRAAPLPVYQRQYSGSRYPQMEQQRELRDQNYRYQPNDAAVRRVEQAHAEARATQQQAQQNQQRQENQQRQQQAEQQQRQQQERNQQQAQQNQRAEQQQRQQQAEQQQRQQQERNQQQAQQKQQAEQQQRQQQERNQQQAQQNQRAEQQQQKQQAEQRQQKAEQQQRQQKQQQDKGGEDNKGGQDKGKPDTHADKGNSGQGKGSDRDQ